MASYIFANKALVTRSMKIEDDSVKNAIISSAYKISVLRDQVGDSLFSKEGNFDEKWLKSGELTKLSLVKKDLMEYVQSKGNNSNSLNGETKKTDWNNLKTNLKTTVLSFLIAPKEETPESINAVFTVLRQPLHKALEEQEIKAGTYNKSLALLRKQFYEKAATKQDKEPPAAPPAPELNKYLLNKELGVM